MLARATASRAAAARRLGANGERRLHSAALATTTDDHEPAPRATAQMNMFTAINDAMRVAMESDPTAVVFGEDVAFGGVFRCSVDLKDTFGPERVFNSPLCEQVRDPAVDSVGCRCSQSTDGVRTVRELPGLRLGTRRRAARRSPRSSSPTTSFPRSIRSVDVSIEQLRRVLLLTRDLEYRSSTRRPNSATGREGSLIAASSRFEHLTARLATARCTIHSPLRRTLPTLLA